MKNLMKLSTLLLTSIVSFNTMAISKDAVDYCEEVREYATQIMKVRQMGMSKAGAIELVTKRDYPEFLPLRYIVDDAYYQVQVNTGYREHTAKIFGTNQARVCYQSMLENGR